MLKVQYNKTGTILDAICEKKVEEIAEIPQAKLDLWKTTYDGQSFGKTTRFAKAITRKVPGIIAEIKKGSPSEGIIRADLDVPFVARSYKNNGASAISIVTDKPFFHGDVSWIKIIKNEISLPIIRKDFILDEKQVYQSKDVGADAVLLIAGILEEAKLKVLYDLIYSLGMEALVEVHNEEEIKKAINIGAEIIGINNRNLKSFDVSTDTFTTLVKLIPDEKIVVAESGIHSTKDLLFMKEHSADAVLIGTHFMKAAEPGKALAELMSVLV